MHVGNRLKKLIESRGYTQAGVAQKMNTPATYLSRVLAKEHMSTEIVEQICGIIDVPLLSVWEHESIKKDIPKAVIELFPGDRVVIDVAEKRLEILKK